MKDDKGYLEAFLGKTFDECLRFWESLRIELPLAKPVGTEPSRIEMNHIARVMLASQTVADFFYFIGREIGHATHPDAETPKGKHGRESRQHAIGAEDAFGRLSTDEEYVEGGTVAEKLYGSCGMVSQ